MTVEQKIVDNIVKSIIWELCEERKYIFEAHLNERYIHHLFSRKLQNYWALRLDQKNLVHPEWATYIMGSPTHCGQYKKQGDKYIIIDDSALAQDPDSEEIKGGSGFLDFAIGKYDNPFCAVEFKFDDSLNVRGLEFDYMKLLDSRNKIDFAISLAVVYGQSNHSGNISMDKLNSYCSNACNALGDKYNSARKFKFYVLELSQNHKPKLCTLTNNSTWQIEDIAQI